MLIREIKKQEIGTKVEFEATVKHCSTTILIGGKYTQRVDLVDHTGSISAIFSFGGTRRSLCNGTLVNIKDAEREYAGVKVLDYSIPTQSEPEPGSPYEWKPDENMTKADWEAKDKRMAKMCSINNATNLVVCLANITEWPDKPNIIREKVKEIANDFLDWIYE